MSLSKILIMALEPGKENAKTRKELSKLLSVSDRNLRVIIADLRALGVPVISNTDKGGYYLPATKEEASEYIKSMNNRAINTFKSVKATKEWLHTNSNMSFEEIFN